MMPPLFAAIERAPKAIGAHIATGARIAAYGESGMTSLHYAAGRHAADAIRVLMGV